MRVSFSQSPDTWLKKALIVGGEIAQRRPELLAIHEYAGKAVKPKGMKRPVVSGKLATDLYRVHMTNFLENPANENDPLPARAGGIVRDAAQHYILTGLVGTRLLAEAIAVAASGVRVFADGKENNRPVTLEFTDHGMTISGKTVEIENHATIAESDGYAVAMGLGDDKSATFKGDARYLLDALAGMDKNGTVSFSLSVKYASTVKMLALSSLLPDGTHPYALIMGMTE